MLLLWNAPGAQTNGDQKEHPYPIQNNRLLTNPTGLEMQQGITRRKGKAE